MRCYNAAMKRPWQFSMGALFALAFWVCIASWAYASAPSLMIPVTWGVVLGAVVVGCFFLCAWIGVRTGNPFAGLMVALGILIFVAIIAVAIRRYRFFFL
jgi:hypothetical protein